jgi:hypothetical protein
MNNTRIALALALCTTFSYNTYAGTWVNWGKIKTDITPAINAVADTLVTLKDSIKEKYSSIVGTNVIISKRIAISGVNSVTISGSGSLIVTHDSNQKEELVIEADEAIMSYIDIQIKNNELTIDLKKNLSLGLASSIIYRVNSATITGINTPDTITVTM